MEDLIPFFPNPGYLALFLGLLACGFGLPVPEEVFLLGGGVLVHLGHTDYLPTASICMFAILIGDSGAFALGKYYAHKVYRIRFFNRLFGSEKSASWIQKHFDGHAFKTTFLARFVPGVRAATFFFAGGHGVPYWKFLAANGIAALLSVPTSIAIAWYFGKNIEEARASLKEFHLWLFAGIALVALGVGGWYFWKRKKKKATAP